MRRATAVIGFRAKTGRAIAVALAGPAQKPSFIFRREIDLTDPGVRETAQPYHAVMELPWADAIVAAGPSVSAIDAVARVALGNLIRELEAADFDVRSVAVVGSIDRDLARIGNPHIRAHAAEGILFRSAIEKAAAAHRLPCRTFSEPDVRSARVKRQLPALGKQAGSPWRSEEKAAATAALLVLP